MKIKVKNSGAVNLRFHADFPDGDLFIAEAGKDIPFRVKRSYFINNLSNKKAVRGKHAHRKLTQIIFAVNGSFKLSLDDGKSKQTIKLKDPSMGIILGPMLWHTMTDFSKDCVILVFADDFYKESDYIRDYKKFREVLR